MACSSKWKNLDGGMRFSAVVEMKAVRDRCASCFCRQCLFSPND